MVPNQSAFTPNYQVAYTINSKGLRDTEIGMKKPKGQFRILLLGDSIIFGQGVSFTETLVQRLERALRESGAFDSVEVINCGVAGYGPHQQRRFLEREGMTYDPDIVILGFCHNDVTNAQRWEELQKLVGDGVSQVGHDSMRRQCPPCIICSVVSIRGW